MDAKDVDDRFTALATSSERSIAAQFRDVFDSVEHAIKSGVSRVKARDELEKMGLKISQPNFNMLLVRIRKERVEAASKSLLKPSVDASHATPSELEVPVPARSPIPPARSTSAKLNANVLPDDWLVAELPPEVIRSLTIDQKAQRRKARDRLFHPSPYDSLSDAEKKAVFKK